MYDWKQDTYERWLVLDDSFGNRRAFSVGEIAHIFDEPIRNQPAFEAEPAKRTVIMLKSHVEIVVPDSVDELVDLITGDRSCKED